VTDDHGYADNERSDDKAQNGYKEERKTLNLLKAGYSYTQTGIAYHNDISL
jgi:hypothetical protein